MSSFRRRGIAVARCIAFLLPVLAHGADDLDEVTITASPLGHGDSLATLVESVDRDELVRRGAASLGDALSNVPGVSASGFAAGASRPIIRGLDSSRVRILEIVRGAGTLRYGSQAIGGVVNTINGRVPVMLDADPLRGEASAAWGSAADSREGAGRIDGHTGTFAWHGDGFLRRTEDYDTPLGTQQGSWFDGKGGSLGAGFVGDAGRAGAAIVRYDAKYGLPNGDSYIDMRQDKLLVRGARDLGWGPLSSVTLDAGYADYEHAERESDGTPVATFLDEEWEARAEALFARVGPFDSSAIGAQFHRRRFAARGEAADYLQPTLS
ncbi:TonB-dependent receptor, partial [bacterium]